MNKITFIERYSSTDEPDDKGRWARKVLYNNELCIGWIKRFEHSEKVMFCLSGFFPTTGNDGPNFHGIYPTYKESQEKLIDLWNEFLKKIK